MSAYVKHTIIIGLITEKIKTNANPWQKHYI
jgi:hypothetical protein